MPVISLLPSFSLWSTFSEPSSADRAVLNGLEELAFGVEECGENNNSTGEPSIDRIDAILQSTPAVQKITLSTFRSITLSSVPRLMMQTGAQTFPSLDWIELERSIDPLSSGSFRTSSLC